MNILITSSCSKKALKQTRKIVDSFGYRISKTTWFIKITQEGLSNLILLLAKKARKNTAISIFNNSDMSLIKFIGSKKRYHTEDSVMCIKSKNIEKYDPLKELISFTSKYHDIGKGNIEFQWKMRDQFFENFNDLSKNKISKIKDFKSTFFKDLFRHEFLSVLVILFVESNYYKEKKKAGFNDFIRNHFNNNDTVVDIENLSALSLAMYAILSHHKPLEKKGAFNTEYPFLLDNDNSLFNNPIENKISKFDVLINNDIDYLLLTDYTLSKLSKDIEKIKNISIDESDIITYMYKIKFSLISGDHFGSRAKPVLLKKTHKLLAKKVEKINLENYSCSLEKHLNDVEEASLLFYNLLEYKFPKLSNKSLEIFSKNEVDSPNQFLWQDDNIKYVKENHNKSNGGFFVVASSTGSGKTYFSAKLATLVSKDKRFTTALGLRTLTLQTKKEYDKLLNLDMNSRDTSILIGSKIIQSIFMKENKKEVLIKEDSEEKLSKKDLEKETSDYKADNDIEDTEQTIVDNDKPSTFLDKREESKFLKAPILVMTIDYLMKAMDHRKAKNLSEILLRIKSADLILDEVDNYSIEDLAAISQLAFVYGLFGRKIIISTATPNSFLVNTLFEFYEAGFNEFDKSKKVDKFILSNLSKDDSFFKYFSSEQVEEFFIDKLNEYSKNIEDSIYHKSEVKNINFTNAEEYINELANFNYETNSKNERLSIGLFRVANIKSGLALYSKLKNNNSNIFPIMYHSNMFLLYRSYLESKLDKTLTRKNKSLEDGALFKDTEEIIGDKTIVIIATPVEEVGRDHDFDWAIVEVSSTRSFIQTVGRVNRHRRLVNLLNPNIYILNENFKLQSDPVDDEDEESIMHYVNPGYETYTSQFKFNGKKDINSICNSLKNVNPKNIISFTEDENSYLSAKEYLNIKTYLNDYLNEFGTALNENKILLFFINEFKKESNSNGIFIKFRNSQLSYNYYLSSNEDIYQETRDYSQKVNNIKDIKGFKNIDYFFKNIKIYIKDLNLYSNSNSVQLTDSAINIDCNSENKTESIYVSKDNLYLGLFTKSQISLLD